MSAAKPTLGASDSARLTSCLDAIADGRDASRWSALEQLLYFCDGADTDFQSLSTNPGRCRPGMGK